MTYGSKGFPNRQPLSEHRFEILLTAAWARVSASMGMGAFADRLHVHSKTIDNAIKGKTKPQAHTLLNSLAACRTALDEPLAEMGLRLVPIDAMCDSDTGTLPIAALLHKVAHAESPDSPGGIAKTHGELLAMEHDIREVHRLTGDWLERISDLRTPRAVA